MTTKEEMGLCIVHGCRQKKNISLGLCHVHYLEFRDGQRSVMIDGHEITYLNWSGRRAKLPEEEIGEQMKLPVNEDVSELDFALAEKGEDLPLFRPTRLGRPGERLRQDQFDRIMELREQLGLKLRRSKTGMITRAEAARLIASLEYDLRMSSGSSPGKLGYPESTKQTNSANHCEVGRQVRIETMVGGELVVLKGRLLGYK